MWQAASTDFIAWRNYDNGLYLRFLESRRPYLAVDGDKPPPSAQAQCAVSREALRQVVYSEDAQRGLPRPDGLSFAPRAGVSDRFLAPPSEHCRDLLYGGSARCGAQYCYRVCGWHYARAMAFYAPLVWRKGTDMEPTEGCAGVLREPPDRAPRPESGQYPHHPRWEVSQADRFWSERHRGGSLG